MAHERFRLSLFRWMLIVTLACVYLAILRHLNLGTEFVRQRWSSIVVQSMFFFMICWYTRRAAIRKVGEPQLRLRAIVAWKLLLTLAAMSSVAAYFLGGNLRHLDQSLALIITFMFIISVFSAVQEVVVLGPNGIVYRNAGMFPWSGVSLYARPQADGYIVMSNSRWLGQEPIALATADELATLKTLAGPSFKDS